MTEVDLVVGWKIFTWWSRNGDKMDVSYYHFGKRFIIWWNDRPSEDFTKFSDIDVKVGSLIQRYKMVQQENE